VAKLRTPRGHMKSVRVPNSSSAMALPNPGKTPLLTKGAVKLRNAGESALNQYYQNPSMISPSNGQLYQRIGRHDSNPQALKNLNFIRAKNSYSSIDVPSHHNDPT
jgi:hypothetical protein